MFVAIKIKCLVAYRLKRMVFIFVLNTINCWMYDLNTFAALRCCDVTSKEI